MRNTIELIKLFIVYHLGLVFTLMVLYASPDEQSHLFEGSFFFLGSAIFIFFSYWNLSFADEAGLMIKVTYILFAILAFSAGLILAMISLFASPNDIPDIQAAFVFLTASIVTFIGFLMMLKHNKREVQNG